MTPVRLSLRRNPSDLGFCTISHQQPQEDRLKPVPLEPTTHNGDSPMAQMQNSQSVALQLEKVRDKLPLLYELDDILLTMIQQRGDVERVSSRNMRLPLQIRPGGKAGLANMDGGDLGRGSGTIYDVAQVTPVFFRHAVEITKLVEYASNAPEKAIENAAKREVKNAMAQFRAFLDKVMQTNGNGVLGTISSIASTTFTMGQAARFRPRLLQPDDSGLRPDAHHESRLMQRHRRRSFRQHDYGGRGSRRHQRERCDRSRRPHRGATRVALRLALSSVERDHRHVAQLESRHLSRRARHSARERK
jgi:hypothetical protein